MNTVTFYAKIQNGFPLDPNTTDQEDLIRVITNSFTDRCRVAISEVMGRAYIPSQLSSHMEEGGFLYCEICDTNINEDLGHSILQRLSDLLNTTQPIAVSLQGENLQARWNSWGYTAHSTK